MIDLVMLFFATSACLTFFFTREVYANDDIDFQLQVKEGLSISISTPSTWAEGDVDTFITNQISINVTAISSNGYHVRMTSSEATPVLRNTLDSATTLPTLSASWTRSSSVTNFWGYSIDDTTYQAVPGLGGTAAAILDSSSPGSGSAKIYFGAKSSIGQASGTYTGKVLISVVTGEVTSSNPEVPTNPNTPTDGNSVAYYNSDSDSTIYTTRTTSGSGTSAKNTTTTEISDGDVTASYAAPQGENAKSNGTSSSLLTTLLISSATVAATAGGILFLLFKRKTDDDEDEYYK